MGYNLEDKMHIIYLRNQLLNMPLERLKKIYSDYAGFCYFVDTLNIALDAENAFFLLDDKILQTAEDVLAHRRFDFKDETLCQAINEVIAEVNAIKALSPNALASKKNSYLAYQETVRGLTYIDQEDFLASMAYDAILIDKLKKKDLSNIKEAYFLASTNYFTECLPEFYYENPERVELTQKKLDELSKERGLGKIYQRMYAKQTIKAFQKVKR